jgi:hypothetical protein
VLTALPFAGVHVPLLLLDEQVSALSILMGIAGLLILGIVVRLLMGVMMRAALDRVLAVGILHQIFDASSNKRRSGRFLTGWRRGRQHDPACRRRTDSVGRRVAAVATTSRRIRQTSNTASRFPS